MFIADLNNLSSWVTQYIEKLEKLFVVWVCRDRYGYTGGMILNGVCAKNRGKNIPDDVACNFHCAE
ncbi:hypothetical protein C8R30_12632 [Nitrosomonas nitrosa]|nr:hypothetical protein C8R30_12632 [Nitrosomonas nitrosa]